VVQHRSVDNTCVQVSLSGLLRRISSRCIPQPMAIERRCDQCSLSTSALLRTYSRSKCVDQFQGSGRVSGFWKASPDIVAIVVVREKEA
jgi:hypothetical protein